VEASTPQQPGQPPAGDYQKKFKIAAGLAAVLGIAAIALAVWGFSTKSDLDDTKKELAAAQSVDSTDTNTLDSLRSKYETIRGKLAGSEADDAQLEADLKKAKSELESADKQVDSAQSEEDKQQAQINQLEKQAQLAQQCAKSAVASLQKLFDEEQADTGTSGTISSLEKVQQECQEALN
jgi:septal ring factor EnvC (AmiA/AmiB activator)